jgi:16S rRNA (guanine527-N7)-methyltransferase
MNKITKYFPDLTDTQKTQFSQLPELYQLWNDQINVISRADMINLEVHHVLHSLAIAKFIQFKKGSKVLDLGTGGGFPGIPLAILFPEVEFTLVDSIGKKIKVVTEVAEALGLKNVTAIKSRAEETKLNGQFDFVVTRAVASSDKLMDWAHQLIAKKHKNAYPNGVIALKGGNLRAELRLLPGKSKEYTEQIDIVTFFKEAYFEEKVILYIQG